jgi:hypothetical protein
MGGTCNSHGIHERCIQNFESETSKGRDLLGDLGLGGRTILEVILDEQWV